MSILINADDSNELTQLFPLERDWLIGRAILSPSNNDNPLDHIFSISENESDDDRSQQVERIHHLSQQLIQRPSRTCFNDIYSSISDPVHNVQHTLKSIVPSQNTLFELTQEKPDITRWTLTFDEDPVREEDDDDGFQSASSSISDEKFHSALLTSTDHWTQALTQAENTYFTWEQRGSYLYHRTRPYLFDIRNNDRPFQHLCLLLLFSKSSSIDRPYEIQYRPISAEEFLRDLCYLLMGLSSQTFVWNSVEQTFELQPDVYVLGYTQTAIELFSRRYILAGNKFFRVQQYIHQCLTHQSETENIFCQALHYYLRYIQNSIAIHDMTQYSLIKFAAHIDPIICSLDLPLSLLSTIEDLEQTIRRSSPNTSLAFVKLSSILHTLLNHQYHTVDPNYFLLLIHLVVYTLQPLLAFLTNLIIQSSYFDRYNEYPILFNFNRLTGLKTVDFWSKTFTIRYLHANNTDTIFHQILPIEYLQKIVNITRSLLLLKLCEKNHPLCSSSTKLKPELKFIYLNSTNHDHRDELREYEREMTEQIRQYEQAQKQKRLDIEQAKVQELMDVYARQDQQRAERKRLADQEKERVMKSKKTLRDEWQEQVDEKQKKLKEEKLAETLADAEINQMPTATTTIIGSRLAAPYSNLVQSVRDEIVAEYDAKMQDANKREEQFRQHVQSNPPVETPKQGSTAVFTSAPSSSSSASSFHTPVVVDSSPSIDPIVDSKPAEDVVQLKPTSKNQEIEVSNEPVIRHTVNEETTQAEYRSTVKLVPSRVLQSTIQNYLRDHDPEEDGRDSEDDGEKEKVYDWDTIIANGPQFKYEDGFDFSIRDSSLSKTNSNASWHDLDLSPLRVWLSHSIGPLIQIQGQLVNRALLNYFFDELKFLDHLNNLRAFYFLATGRFGLGFCSELSRILLSNDDARSIYHINSMRQILYTSLDQTGQLTYFIDLLQLKVKSNLPNALTLLDSNLLDYFDLNYSVQWPLNILISQELLDKYQIIFRFLLRVLIVKQVLNEIWLMLKGCKQQNATLAQLHQYRHQMQHFMTVLINYITNQVIQIAWNEFMNKIQQAKHVNDIVIAHHEYLDRTMLNCLLTPNAAPIFNEVNRVLTLIIRFRCQLKTFSWILDADHTDPSDNSAQALRTTFEKYHIAVLSLFKVLSKLVEKGYKTSLADLLIRLNHNGYYDRLALSTRPPKS